MLRLLTPRFAVFLILVFAAESGFGQAPLPPVAGTAGLELMLRRLETTGVVMITNVHPDDESNALIAKLVHGLGLRVVEVTLTRGEGGQNDLGTEQGEALSVLRTEELLSAHRLDGAEQLFGRAIDFGYSFSVEETLAKWGKEEMLADLVRLIRMVRPDVIISMSPDGGGGGQHHQTSARLTREAFDAAADRRRFPEQIEETLEPWQATTLYVPIAGPPADEAASRPGSESRLAESRRESRRAESKPDSRPGDVTIDLDVFDSALGCTYAEIGIRARGMHKSQGMARLGALPGPFVAHYRVAAGVIGAGGNAFDIPTRLPQFKRVAQDVRTHVEDLTVRLLVGGLREVRRLEEAGTKPPTPEGFLATKEAQFLQAIALAAGLRIEALSDAGTPTPGQEIMVSVFVANRLAPGLEFAGVALQGFDAAEGGCATRPSGRLPPGGLVKCESKVRIPKDARYASAHWRPLSGALRTELEPDVPFGAPFRPTPYRALIRLSYEGEPLEYDVPIEVRDGSDTFAWEKRHEILVIPPADREAPAFQVIEYPHVRRRHLCPVPERLPARLDLGTASRANPLTVGSIPGPCDPIGDAITRLGASVCLLDGPALRDALPRQDCPVIVVGSRALELRPEVRRAADRLMKFVEDGGTLVVLYQRSGLDEHCGAPYPAKPGGNRITAEDAPVKVLLPDHPVFNFPNKLTAEDWGGWVQERGRSFLDTKDARYVDLIEMEDPFEFNKGAKRGALVEARIGKGRWIYVGLSLSRQLEAGVPGAYRLLENLLSLRN